MTFTVGARKQTNNGEILKRRTAMSRTWKLACLVLPVAGAWGCGTQDDPAQAQPGSQPASIESKQQAVLGTYEGCRGEATAVCAELVDPIYYSNHSSCQRNPVCVADYYTCDVACPAPTGREIPNIHVVAAGRTSPRAALQIGYIWSAGGTGGFYSNSLYGSSIALADVYRWSALTIGVGVNAESIAQARVHCYTWEEESSATSNVSVAWANGQSSTYSCENGNKKDCWVSVPVNGGFTATCNLVLDVPSSWACNPSWYGTNDGCDCGCYANDPDCNGAGTTYPQAPGQWPSSCGYCWDNNHNWVSCN
jgi:hypothetical protein